MKIVRWVLAVGLCAASAVAVSQAAEAAPPPTRVVGTSSVTGVTYTATWSCAGGQVRIAGVQPADVDVWMRFKVLPMGENGSGLLRQITRPGSFAFSTGGDARNDNDQTSVVVEDGFANATSFVPVLTLTIPDCPDYTIGTRSVFQGVTPQRVLDTRAATAINYSGAKPGAGAIVQVPASAFPGLPADATAVSVTVTGTEADQPGFIQAFPTNLAVPGSSSNVNLAAAGATVANLAVVPLGSDRSISLLTSGGSHLLVDVNGYFVPAPGAVAAGRLETLATQKRLLDTRPGSAVNHTGPQPNDTVLRVDLTASSSGLPLTASAAVVNVTATESTGPGFVQVDAGGALVKGSSSALNVTGAGQTVAGLSIVPLAADGSIDLYASGGTHLIVDLIGWFTGPGSTVSTVGRFVPLPPERVYDSRLDSMVNVQSFWDAAGIRDQTFYLPALEQQVGAIFVNGTATGNALPGFVTLGPYNPLAPTSSMNVPAPNSAVANASIIRGSLGFGIRTSSAAHVIVDLAGYFTLASV